VLRVMYYRVMCYRVMCYRVMCYRVTMVMCYRVMCYRVTMVRKVQHSGCCAVSSPSIYLGLVSLPATFFSFLML